MFTLALSAVVCASLASPESFTFEWTNSDGDVWAHVAMIERPDPDTDLGRAVMIFGGGYATDIAWTVPAYYDNQGQRQQLTIDGEPTHDADDIAAALVGAGFTVLRYSAIRAGDPLHAENPLHAQTRPFPETLDLARAAWHALLEASGSTPERTFALGHSMGAARAVLASDGDAAGYVLLAGAYITPNTTSPRRLADQAADTPGEDYDGSGALSGWERAAAGAIRAGTTRTADMLRADGGELAWPSDVLAASDAPVLAVWAELDPISYHGPVLEHLLPGRVETVFVPDLGHAFTPEVEGRTGPIDAGVVGRVAGWLVDQVPEG